ncbi:MAG: hypothetical protein J07HX64_01331 [halophilic archaeon J07HX64]|jgi:hypothetical protein|nr:MAG: hypothetical protein J07HX64_01331 [halophilic archaeon J07HX64]
MNETDSSLGDQFSDFLDSVGLENLTDDYREHKHEADEALERAFDGDTEQLATVPELAEVDRVNSHRSGDDVLVPVVAVVFSGAGEPRLGRVWEITGEILRTVHPVFSGTFVRHIDVQFAYADSDETTPIFRRITASQGLTESFVTDPTVDIADLRARVEAGDDGDDGVPPVNWQRFDAGSPAGSGAYAGPAPIRDVARRSDSVVAQCVSNDFFVTYGAGTGTF